MGCSRWINEAPCGRSAELKWGIPLCESCSMFVWMNGMRLGRQMVKDAVDRAGGDIYWDYGITYYLLLPNGNVKIGHVAEPSRLAKRWEVISRDHFGRVIPLATEYGGRLKEAYRHAELEKYRVWVAGEQFIPSAEVMQAASIGHVPMGHRGVQEFARWTVKPETIAKWNAERAAQ